MNKNKIPMNERFEIRTISFELRKIYEDYFFTDLISNRVFRIKKETYDNFIESLKDFDSIPFEPISDITELVKQKSSYGITQE